MPHLLVAGTTGSGKSVAINAMILSLLYKSEPKNVRFILIDPKMLELSVYQDIPHLLAPVVTDMKQAANALQWCVAEMDRRYKLMSWLGVRNLSGYNHKIADAEKHGRKLEDPATIESGNPQPLQALPLIVVVIDELADLMMVAGQEGRGADRAPGAEGARRGHPPDPRHAAPVGGRDHRPDQGQHPDAHRLPGGLQGRFAHHPRPVGGGRAARRRRHALPAGRHRPAAAHPRRLRRRP